MSLPSVEACFFQVTPTLPFCSYDPQIQPCCGTIACANPLCRTEFCCFDSSHSPVLPAFSLFSRARSDTVTCHSHIVGEVGEPLHHWGPFVQRPLWGRKALLKCILLVEDGLQLKSGGFVDLTTLLHEGHCLYSWMLIRKLMVKCT